MKRDASFCASGSESGECFLWRCPYAQQTDEGQEGFHIPDEFNMREEYAAPQNVGFLEEYSGVQGSRSVGEEIPLEDIDESEPHNTAEDPNKVWEAISQNQFPEEVEGPLVQKQSDIVRSEPDSDTTRNDDLEVLAESLEAARVAIENLEAIVASKDEEIDSLASQVAILQHDREDPGSGIQGELELVQQAIEEAKEEIEEKDATIASLGSELDILREVSAVRGRELARKEELLAIYSDSKALIEQKDAELDLMRQSLEELKSKCSELEEIRESQGREITHLSEQTTGFQALQRVKEELERELASFRERESTLQVSLDESMSSKEATLKEKLLLEDQLKETEARFISELSHAQKQIAEMETAKQVEAREILSLESMAQGKDGEIAQLRQTMEELERRLLELEQDKEYNLEEIGSLTEELQILKDQNSAAKEEIDVMEHRAKALQSSLGESQSRLLELECVLQAKVERIDALESVGEDKDADLNDLRHRQKEMVSQNLELGEALEQHRNEVNSLQDELSHSRVELSELEAVLLASNTQLDSTVGNRS
uniref:Uncharacterized protein n=1 Tax=Compsopogon caeruleus TaxID=31354 RepID=A0A6T6CK98_9RHOD|mmetsp:Transcript_1979/g.3535  ORF Transcript_1979/g.3535 Transcript_1979/m.3535 type:complete len:546 (+) Transcript_1979:637-2274(+)